jgi:hypothetical protein
MMNPLASHYLRLAVWLFVATPVVALLVMMTADTSFSISLIITLWVWFLVCVIFAIVATAGLVARLLGWGIRAIRR